jgi:hypothetical protein
MDPEGEPFRGPSGFFRLPKSRYSSEKAEMASSPYKALDNNNHEIRIFEFLEVSPPRAQRPRFGGTLKHISLIDIEPYDALSYCWGVSTQNHQVSISRGYGDSYIGCWTHITDNLQSALAALWKRRGDKMTIRIWVDALCINQNDLYERSQQVQMMRQIYSRAEKVLAWVGSKPQTVLSSLSMGVFNLNAFDMSYKLSEGAWHALKEFFNEEYWRRVWIIQEITVASTVVMLYGDLELPWIELVTFLEALHKHSVQEWGESELDVSGNGIGASHLLKFREHWIDTNKPITLRQAMLWTLHTKATDPRDKIFALLGLCHDGFRLVPIPNYKQPLESIISEMSKLIFSRTRSLDLMCLKGTGKMLKDGTGLPSWTPNWPNLWSSNTTLHEREILRSPTTLDLDPVLKNSTSSVLRVEAIAVGSILRISSDFETENSHSKSTQLPKNPIPWIYYTEKLREEIPELGKPTSSQVVQKMTIWRTLRMKFTAPSDSPDDVDECFNQLWTPQGRGSLYNTRVIDWIDNNAWFRIGPWTLREWSQLPVPDTRENYQSPWSITNIKSNALQLNRQHISKRRIQAWDTTNRALEQLLGSGLRLAEISTNAPALVSPQAEVNDNIFFIKGCKTPMILRPVHNDRPSRYKVMGGVWLLSETLGLDNHQDWSEGKGGFLNRARVEVLELL